MRGLGRRCRRFHKAGTRRNGASGLSQQPRKRQRDIRRRFSCRAGAQPTAQPSEPVIPHDNLPAWLRRRFENAAAIGSAWFPEAHIDQIHRLAWQVAKTVISTFCASSYFRRQNTIVSSPRLRAP